MAPSTAAAQGRPAADGTRVVLQLRWLHAFQFAGYYAAKAQGYYREAGLDVVFAEGSPGQSPVDEVTSGRAQYGVGNSEILLHRLQGERVVVLAVIFQHSPSVLLMRGDSGIESPQDLAGKRVMLRKGIDSAELLAMLRDEGVTDDRLQRMDLSFNLDDLVEGKTDAYHAYETDQPYLLQQKGVPFSVIRPRAYGIDFYGDSLFTSEREIDAHPERVKAFREASLRGWEYAMAHPEEIVDLILAEYSSRNTRGHLLFEAESMKPIIHPELIEVGHSNPGRWQRIADTYVHLGMVEADGSLEGFIYDPEPPLWTEGTVRRVIALALTAGAGILVLLLFNNSLRRAVRQRTSELSLANAELRRHRENLEDLVLERTREMERAVATVKTLHGLLPICASCKKIRDEQGRWNNIEAHIRSHSDAEFTHSICPECSARLYPEYEDEKDGEEK
jgi:ABC-type nitrate/sulfonate/bicarbonate transport system substrate-binding protein